MIAVLMSPSLYSRSMREWYLIVCSPRRIQENSIELFLHYLNENESHQAEFGRSSSTIVRRRFFPWPCLRAPGRGVSGFLAGPALVFCCCFSSMIQILYFVIFTRMSHVSQCTKGFAPIRESCTDLSPLINR